MGANATFFARVVDTNPKMMKNAFVQAAKHKGTSLIEVLQNCVIFNDKVHEDVTGKELRNDHQLIVEHGKPMIFGKNKDKGIIKSGSDFIVAKIGENGVTESDVVIHDAHTPDITVHTILSRMSLPEYPVVLGIIRQCETAVYETMLYEQIEQSKQQSKIKNVNDLLLSGNTFLME
jgi:2-oxoglutarate ferredoxin oxidoreductase subunit beta